MDLFVRFDEKKTNFENFSSQNLVIFQKKHTKRGIFATFFFDPPFFVRKQTNYQKNHIGHPK